MTVQRQGFVVSDLHLLARRHDASKLNQIRSVLTHADFIILNGDIFDFSWAYRTSMHEAVTFAVEFLQGLCRDYPHCHVYFIMGNHDDYSALAERLSSFPLANFSWHPTHFQFEGQLFMHGDLALKGSNPFTRVLKTSAPRRSLLRHFSYDAVISARLHQPVSRLFIPRFCAMRIARTIRRFAPEMMPGLTDVYFGHTHRPFRDFTYEAVRFHNSGSAIKHLVMEPIHVRT